MYGIEEELLSAPVTAMTGDQRTIEGQPHFIHRGDDLDLSMGILRWHRIAVPVEADQRE